MMSGSHLNGNGLLIRGLHNECLSSDSNDADYLPGKKLNISQTSSDNEDGKTGDDGKQQKKTKKKVAPKKRKKKSLPKRKNKRRKIAFRCRDVSSDSSDSDYIVEAKRVIGEQPPKITKKKFTFAKHSHPPCDDTWSSLPVEVLSHIFSYVIILEKGVRCLCRCAQVCQNWYVIGNQAISWQGIVDLSSCGGKKVANDKLLAKLCNTKLKDVKGLNLCGWVHLTKVGVQSMADNCHKLEYLSISNSQEKVSIITADNIISLAKNTNLEYVNFASLHVNICHIITLIKLCGDRLTHLNFSENVSVGSAVITSICENCPRLKVLNVSATSIRSICFLSLQRSCNKLEELYLANLALEVKASKNNDNDKIDNLGFPHLKVLSVAKSNVFNWFTNKVIQMLLRTSHDLSILDIRGNRGITEDGLRIPSNKVERLFISQTKITLNTIQMICFKWNDILWDLDLSWTDASGTQFDGLISHLIGSNEPCKKLINLNLAGTSVTDTAVKSILITCLALECLDLTSCRGITRGNKRFHDGAEAIQNLRKSYGIHLTNDEGLGSSKI